MGDYCSVSKDHKFSLILPPQLFTIYSKNEKTYKFANACRKTFIVYVFSQLLEKKNFFFFFLYFCSIILHIYKLLNYFYSIISLKMFTVYETLCAKLFSVEFIFTTFLPTAILKIKRSSFELV